MVTVRNMAGPVKVGAAWGVQCESGSGGINISNIAGGMRVSTSLGNIMASLLAARRVLPPPKNADGSHATSLAALFARSAEAQAEITTTLGIQFTVQIGGEQWFERLVPVRHHSFPFCCWA